MAPPLSILVIDDDPVMRELLDALLGLNGHITTVAASGAAGLARLTDAAAPALDVVLTDLHMPGLQGAALAEALRAARPASTLLVGMSGSSPTDAEMQLFDGFLHKPFTTAHFDAVVADAHNARSARSADAAPASGATPVLDPGIFDRLRASLPWEQLRSMYAMTLADAAERITVMRSAIATGDLATLRSNAHALKGVTGMVGASELHHRAGDIEISTTPDNHRLDEFAQACERLQRMLDSFDTGS